MILRHSITNNAAKEIACFFNIIKNKNINLVENLEKDSRLMITKSYQICNNCNTIIENDMCQVCKIKTDKNRCILFDAKQQLKSILTPSTLQQM